MINSLTKKQKSFILLPILVLLVSFCACHFTLAYFDRFSSDDYANFARIREMGIFGTIANLYMTNEGAFGAFFINGFVFKLSHLFKTAFVHDVVATLIIFSCFFFFFKAVLAKFFSLHDKLLSFALSVILIANFYYTDLAISDVWYWTCGNLYILMPSMLLLVGGILIHSQNKVLRFFAFTYFFLFGASRFNYAVLTIATASLLIAYEWITTKKLNKILAGIWCLLTLGLLIYVAAPGNYVRREDENTVAHALSDYIASPFVMSFTYLKSYLIAKLPFHLLFLFPVVFIAYLYKKESSLKDYKKHLKTLALLGSLLCILIYTQCFSMFLAKGSQTLRTLCMMNLFICLFFMYGFFVLGLRLNNEKVLRIVFVLCIVISSALLSRRLMLNYQPSKVFAAAVDERDQLIKEAIANYETNPIDRLVLKKLPPSNWLHSGELTKRDGPNPMNNVFMESYYKPPFVLDIEEE